MSAQLTTPPAVGINQNIPLEVQRDLRTLADYAFGAQSSADDALAGLKGKVGKTPSDLLEVSEFVSKQIQAGGQFPISLTGLAGGNSIRVGPGLTVSVLGAVATIGQKAQGPGAGTYTVGAKLTTGGNNGTITIDAYGRITAIQQAS
jgi:hypothetical protein